MSITNMTDLFIQIRDHFAQAITEQFSGHPIAQSIRTDSREIISNIIQISDLTVKGSAGMGNWTSTPWIAIFNKNETDGAQEGIYVVYLFSEDLQRVYLTLNQGVTKPIETHGRKAAFQKMKAKAIDIRTNYELQGFNSDDNIHVADLGLGSDYEKVTIYYKEYSLSNLPSEDILISDLKKMISFYNHYLLDSNVLTTGTNFEGYIGRVEEGKRMLKKHYVRERNPRIIKEAKRIAFEQFGELKCEVCGFVFKDHYGERAEDYIEGHHKKPISEMEEGATTTTNDIALVCSNCHRTIHIKMPWLTIEEIKEIYH